MNGTDWDGDTDEGELDNRTWLGINPSDWVSISGNLSLSVGGNTGTGIYQDVTGLQAGSYSLDFWYRFANQTTTTDVEMRVYVTDESNGSATIIDETVGGKTWDNVSTVYNGGWKQYIGAFYLSSTSTIRIKVTKVTDGITSVIFLDDFGLNKFEYSNLPGSYVVGELTSARFFGELSKKLQQLVIHLLTS